MRFLKSKVQILAFGEENTVDFGADATKLLDVIRRVEEQLRSYNQTLENTIRVSARLTDEGVKVTANLDQITQSGTKLTTVLEGTVTAENSLQQALNLTSETLVVTRGREEKLREERERAKRVSIELAEADIKRANAARLAARATGRAIARQLPTAPAGRFGASIEEARALGNAIGRLQEIQQRFNVSQQQVIRIFRRVQDGGIAAYAGVNRQVANASLSILKANEAIGQTNRRLAETSAIAQTAGRANVQAARKSEIGWRSFGRLIFVNVVSRAFGALLNILRESIDLAAEFSLKIGEIRTIQGDNIKATGQWVGELRELSEAFGIPILDAAEAAYQTLSNQIAKGAEVSIFLADAQKFATAGVSTLTDSTNLLSSAINAYSLRASDAEAISDSFFKTIELGRLRTSDIANSLGRVGVIAGQLGITLDETNAAIATLTIQGIRADEALTLLRNIMLKLIRPTDEMKKKFAEFGVESGEALIQTFGFSGAIQKFSEIAQREGTPAIGDLFGRVRAITGILGLAKNGGDAFADTLDKVSNAAGATDEAFEKVSQTIGFRFNKEVEAIRNFVNIDLGDRLLGVLLNVTDAFGGLAKVVKAFGVAIALLTAAFIAQKVILVALTIAYAVYDAAAISATFATSAFTAALLANPFTFVVAGIILATAAIAGLILVFGNAEKEIDDSVNAMIDDLNQLRDAEIKASDEVNKELRESLDFRFKQRQQQIAEERSLINEQLTFELDALKEIDKELKRTFRDATKALKDSIRESEQEAKRAMREIERSAKRVREAIQQDLVDEFSRSLENLLPEDKIAALDDRISDLITGAGELFGNIGFDTTSTFDDVLAQLDEAADRIQEIDKIRQDAERDVSRLIDRRDRILRKNEDAEIKFLRRRSDLEAQFRRAQGDPEKQAKIIERIRRVEEDATRAIRRRREEFTKIDQQLETQQELIKTITELGRRDLEVAKERQALEKARQAQLKLDALNARDVAIQRKIELREFEDSFRKLQAFDPVEIVGKEGAEEARRRLDESADAAREILELIKDGAERRRLIESIETKRLAALTTIRIIESQKALKAISRSLEEERKQRAEVFADATRELKQFTKVSEDEAKKAAEALAKVFKETSLTEIIAGPIEDLQSSLKAAIDGTQEDLDAFIKRIDEIRTQARTRPIDPFRFNPEDVEKVIRGFIDVARAVTNAAKAQQEFRLIQESLAQIKIDLGEIVKPVTTVAERLEEARKSAKGLSEALEKATQIRERISVLQAQGFQTGGIVPGRGTRDSVPALLTPGEFVVNAASTRKFFTQLQAINSGSVQRFQEGGIVNNVGDINVSFQNTPSNVDGREIARAIKKELFRGSVRLR